jgi:hypothetical protein
MLVRGGDTMTPLFAIAFCSVALTGQAELKRDVPVTQRAADAITLRSGERLAGYIVAPPPADNVQILVRRDWLRRSAPALYKATQPVEGENARLARLERVDRIRRWQMQRSEPRALAIFLRQELQRTEMQIEQAERADQAPTQLMLLEYPRVRVFSHYLQPSDRRQIVLLAWEHELANPEDRAAAALARELAAQNVDVRFDRADLVDRVGATRETDQQWAVRVAFTEYAYLGKPHYQGAKGMLARSDADAPAPSVSDLLGGALKGELSGLLDGKRAKSTADNLDDESTTLRSSGADGFNGVRITRSDQDPAASRVTVRTRFFARLPNGSWNVVWQHVETADTRQSRPGQEQIIADDPQIAQSLELFKRLGVTPDQNTLATALRVGAAVKQAQEIANTAFEDFLRGATLHLDSPLLLPAESQHRAGGK